MGQVAKKALATMTSTAEVPVLYFLVSGGRRDSRYLGRIAIDQVP